MKKSRNSWLRLNNFKSVEKLINLPEDEIITDTLCFHCQQGVEKFLKGFLIALDIEFGRIHNIEYLSELYERIDKEWDILISFIFLQLKKQEAFLNYFNIHLLSSNSL